MATPYLTFQQIAELTQAAIDSGLIIQPRPLLFREIRPSFVVTLNLDPVPLNQFRLDITRLNDIERLEDGSVPLELYLRNAADLIRDLPQARVFQKYQSIVTNIASGLSALAPLTHLPGTVTTKEAIIHQDDTVDLAFVQGCIKAAVAVAKLLVPRYDNGVQRKVNGAPWIFNGTGWLLSPDLVMTNHHVINSRPDGEPAASAADFDRQGQDTMVRFDYDSETAQTTDVTVKQVEAKDSALDYCILRLNASVPRHGLSLFKQSIQVTPTTYLPLNVIQHPQGKAKRVAIRNNLAVEADGDVVRYYTDTDFGSSGSPVFDDRWQVVALHRGAMLHSAKFQGKDTAFVNVGSQIARIVAQLKVTAPALCAEFGI
jgi:V8-like Glu-specific endopeptidase